MLNLSKCLIAMVLLGTGIAVSNAHAAKEYQAIVSPSPNPDESDPQLFWRYRKIKVHASREGDQTSPVVLIKGEFRKKGWGLFWNRQWLVKQGSNTTNFIFRVPLTGPKTQVVLKAVGPSQKKDIILFVNFSEFADFRKTYPKDGFAQRKRFNLFVSMGPSFINYQEQNVPDISLIGLTAKLSLGYLLAPPRWDLAFNTFITALPISQTTVYYDPSTSLFSTTASASTVKVSARFLGINGRVGYSLPFVKAPWKLSLMAGWYFTTMIVTENAFGFKNMAGPQFFPVLSRAFAGGSSLLVYAKYSPIIGLPFGNRELAAGAGYVLPLKNGHPMTFNLDYANVSFALPGEDGVSTTAVASTSISFSVGYGF